jgi:hypothetical protein
MITFDPPQLLDQVQKALRTLIKESPLEYDAGYWLPVIDDDFDPGPYADEAPVTADTLVEGAFRLPHTESFSLTIRELLEWHDALDSGTLKDRSEYRGPTRTVIYVEPVNDRAICFTQQGTVSAIETKSTIESSEGTLNIDLVSQPTPFSLFLAKEGGCDEPCPPFETGDQYVSIVHRKGVSSTTTSAAADAYLFELSATFGLDFRRNRCPEMFGGWDDLTIGQDSDEEHVFRLRPVNVTFGLPELYQHYLKATNASNTEHAIINYVKVIEYVASTAVRLTAHSNIRQRLLSQEALAPDASFIDGLVRLVEEQRINKVDAKSLKLALETCCDAVLLAKASPPSLHVLFSIKESDSSQVKQKAMNELSDCLTSTRNQLSHAKVNYEPTGKECGPDELDALAACARMASIQAIRWYAGLSEVMRVG